MTDNIVIITTETTKDKLIDYIGHPCTTNWRRLAKQEKLNKPVKNGGVCGKCMFRDYLEQFMVNNPEGSIRIKRFMTEVQKNPEMYPRISRLSGIK